MKRYVSWVALMGLTALVVVLGGCASGQCTDCNAGEGITAAQLRAMMADGAPLVIVDVRTPGEFEVERIPGSVNIPLSELPARLGELGRDDRIVVVCGSGLRSVQGVEILLDGGFTDVYNLTGGLQAWDGELEPSG